MKEIIEKVIKNMTATIKECGCHTENCERFFSEVSLDACVPTEDVVDIHIDVKREDLFNATVFICGWLSDCEVKKSRNILKKNQCKCECSIRVPD